MAGRIGRAASAFFRFETGFLEVTHPARFNVDEARIDGGPLDGDLFRGAKARLYGKIEIGPVPFGKMGHEDFPFMEAEGRDPHPAALGQLDPGKGVGQLGPSVLQKSIFRDHPQGDEDVLDPLGGKGLSLSESPALQVGKEFLHQHLIEIRKGDMPKIGEQLAVERTGIIPDLTRTHARLHFFPPFLEVSTELDFLRVYLDGPAFERGKEFPPAAMGEPLGEYKTPDFNLCQNEIQLLADNVPVGRGILETRWFADPVIMVTEIHP